jgi:hypothetical protein
VLKGWNGSSIARISSLATLSLESLKEISQERNRGSERVLERLVKLFSSKKWARTPWLKGYGDIYTLTHKN